MEGEPEPEKTAAHKFWDTQPVPRLGEQRTTTTMILLSPAVSVVREAQPVLRLGDKLEASQPTFPHSEASWGCCCPCLPLSLSFCLSGTHPARDGQGT